MVRRTVWEEEHWGRPGEPRHSGEPQPCHPHVNRRDCPHSTPISIGGGKWLKDPLPWSSSHLSQWGGMGGVGERADLQPRVEQRAPVLQTLAAQLWGFPPLMPSSLQGTIPHLQKRTGTTIFDKLSFDGHGDSALSEVVLRTSETTQSGFQEVPCRAELYTGFISVIATRPFQVFCQGISADRQPGLGVKGGSG